jgi:ubiquinone/menaquinone biosynthesis C-methylase UbiE
MFVKVVAAGMESRFRYRFFGPTNILRGAGIKPGKVVLEVGCGTGYFTLPAARLIGAEGRLVAMDVLQESVELVSRKVQEAGVKNVRVLKGDALDTGLESGTFHAALLLGVIPAPMLPLNRLLPEMHRVLKAHGTLAVWPPIPGWLPHAILRSGLFSYAGKRGGVHGFLRYDAEEKEREPLRGDAAPY